MRTLLFILALSFCFVDCFGEEDTKVVFSKLNQEVDLECEVSDAVWKFKANESIIEYDNLEAGDNLQIEEGNLKILKLEHKDIGVYACFNVDDELVQQFSVEVAFRLKSMPASVSVDLGGNTGSNLHCTVLGEHGVVVRWFHRPEDSDAGSELTAICGVENDHCFSSVDSEDLLNIPQVEEVKEREEKSTTARPFSERLSIQLEHGDGSLTSILKIENAQLEDRAIYVCRAIAIEKSATEVCTDEDTFCMEERTLLRVRDPYAAIWPFIGIVLEVVVLCLVIFVCERRKKDDDKDDSDNDRYTGNNVSSNNSLRQRK